ncbi:FAS1-like dehydratase domain-containing protein [Nocardioides alcanivorans]|uniref:FAS1-like dehydratase domain-containing protein n=1 Tax=Nocardioides alcanivorans TaxID=2897352 RepID=UPI001F445B68|nr:MaoC family dehydratase N-terminal domain-containing protein [Nocardioides alcanivorans]
MSNSLLTEEVLALKGRTVTYTAPDPAGAAAGRYFGLAIGDDNPLYSDAGFAKEQGLRGVTWPPTLICETNQYADLPIDRDGYAGHTWGLDLPGTRQVRGGNSYVFHRRVRPDDMIVATWSIDDVVGKVNGRGHEMVIITSTARYATAEGEPLAENTETIIFVGLEQKSEGGKA